MSYVYIADVLIPNRSKYTVRISEQVGGSVYFSHNAFNHYHDITNITYIANIEDDDGL